MSSSKGKNSHFPILYDAGYESDELRNNFLCSLCWGVWSLKVAKFYQVPFLNVMKDAFCPLCWIMIFYVYCCICWYITASDVFPTVSSKFWLKYIVSQFKSATRVLGHISQRQKIWGWVIEEWSCCLLLYPSSCKQFELMGLSFQISSEWILWTSYPQNG